ILALVAVRIVWRQFHPPPPEPPLPRGLAWLARANHWLLYAVFVLMPVSGYLLSAEGDYPVRLYFLLEIPPLPRSETVTAIGRTVHLTGQWAVYALVVLHVAATVWHVAIRRDGTLARMLPRQEG
ncbi:MAG: cytochrome b/b6 domain-containing protein, partial [Methylobacteriaceae bacterium]|nr:cytochrome b/b6 domain-containing protein [Methylobacteriaceae bacterium]